MLDQSSTFREELFALLFRFGMPKTAEGFTLMCVEADAPISLRVTFAPEFEVEACSDNATVLLNKLVAASEEAALAGRAIVL